MRLPGIRVVASFGGRPSTLPPFVLLSIVFHVAAFAAMILMPGLRSRPPISPDAVMVELVAGLPTPTSRAAPEPAVVPPVREAEPEPEPEEASVTPLEPEITRKKPEAEDPPPRPKPRPPAQQTPDDTVGEAGSVGKEGPGGGGASGALEGLTSEFDWYRDAVLRALYLAWRKPSVAGLREAVDVEVRFEIVRDGRVRALGLERESGVPMLDRSALRAVQEASLPALPRNLGRGVQPARVVFRLYPDDF